MDEILQLIEAGHESGLSAGIAILTAGAVIVVTLIVWHVIKRFASSATSCGSGERWGDDTAHDTYDINRDMYFPREAKEGDTLYSSGGCLMIYEGGRWKDKGKRHEHPSRWLSNE